jgi:hypothetical protein
LNRSRLIFHSTGSPVLIFWDIPDSGVMNWHFLYDIYSDKVDYKIFERPLLYRGGFFINP